MCFAQTPGKNGCQTGWRWLTKRLPETKGKGWLPNIFLPWALGYEWKSVTGCWNGCICSQHGHRGPKRSWGRQIGTTAPFHSSSLSQILSRSYNMFYDVVLESGWGSWPGKSCSITFAFTLHLVKGQKHFLLWHGGCRITLWCKCLTAVTADIGCECTDEAATLRIGVRAFISKTSDFQWPSPCLIGDGV